MNKGKTNSAPLIDLTEEFGVYAHAWQAAVPLIAAGVGAAGSAAGGKKAAGGGQAQIPEVFKRSVANALRQTGYGTSMPSWTGPFTAGLTPLQSGAMNFIGRTLGQGEEGLQSAQRTIQSAAEQGLSPSDIELARTQTEPLFQFLKQRGMADLREQQAQGGRFFSTGALSETGDFLNRMVSERQASLLPLAMQMQQMRVGAAQSLPAFLLGQQGLGAGALQAGEAERSIGQQDINARMQEFIRTGPAGIIGLLAQLMGGTPLVQQPVAPNFMQIFGSGLGGLSQSPGFWQYMSQFGGGGGPSSGYQLPDTGIQ